MDSLLVINVLLNLAFALDFVGILKLGESSYVTLLILSPVLFFSSGFSIKIQQLRLLQGGWVSTGSWSEEPLVALVQCCV